MHKAISWAHYQTLVWHQDDITNPALPPATKNRWNKRDISTSASPHLQVRSKTKSEKNTHRVQTYSRLPAWISVKCPLDLLYGISCWWFYWPEPLSPTVSRYFASKYIWDMTLTYYGHVMSSDTCPFDIPYTISYWRSIGTEPLSASILEILGSIHVNEHTDKWTNGPTHKTFANSIKCLNSMWHCLCCISGTAILLFDHNFGRNLNVKNSITK